MARQAQAVQVVVDHAARAGVGGHGGHVLGVEPVGLGPAPAHRRVVVADQAHHLVTEQAAQVQILRRLGPVADDHVHLALGQLVAVVGLAAEGMDFNGAQRGQLLEPRHQLGQKQRIEVIAGRHRKRVLGRGGLKPPRIGKQGFGTAQDVGRWLQHAQPGLGGHHLGPRAHQQRIARNVAQPLQCTADRWLVHAQADGCAGNTAFRKHGMQHLDEMKVDLVEKRLWFHIF